MSTVVDRDNTLSAPPLVAEGWREVGTGATDATWRGNRGLVVVLAWLTLGVLAALQQAASFAVQGRLDEQWVAAIMQLPRFLLWAPLTPLILAALRRFPLERGRRTRHLLLHLFFALLAVSFVESIMMQLYFAAERAMHTAPANRPSAVALTVGAIVARELSGVFTYLAIGAVVFILDHKRQQETLEARLQAEVARAQVQAIKMQVQPHFLFNTLHTINILIRQNPATAEQMLVRLGDLLRYTLSRATVSEVPLRAELEVLTLYLEIERVRFHDRLSVHVRATPETLGALVPDLLLQPLAENAIKHGLGGTAARGEVCIASRRDGDDLLLEVSDSGSGPAAAARDGVGLTTVRARLSRLYGRRQSLTIGRGPGGGCVATVRLPFHEAARV